MVTMVTSQAHHSNDMVEHYMFHSCHNQRFIIIATEHGVATTDIISMVSVMYCNAIMAYDGRYSSGPDADLDTM